MSHVLFDLRVALRAAGRQPVFTAVVVATLAVGIGASMPGRRGVPPGWTRAAALRGE